MVGLVIFELNVGVIMKLFVIVVFVIYILFELVFGVSVYLLGVFLF